METLPAPFLDTVHVLGWTLLHFLWQGAAVGALYALVRMRVPRGRARYALGMAALAVLACCPLLTGWRLLDGMAAAVDADATVLAAMAVTPAAGDAAQPAWRELVNAALPWLVALWAIGVLLLTLRAWRHWRQIKRLLREASPLPEWEARLRELGRRLGLRRRVRLLWSQRVATPTLIGWLRPVILLPAAVALGFPVAQVELILAHELGHIRRWDHLANLLQLVLETVLFYHPVVHWISRDVRNEREICCDELVLEVTGGSPRVYVEALADLEDLRDGHHGLALAASGGVLVERVRRIAGMPLVGRSARPQARFVVGLLLAMLAAAAAHYQLARLDQARMAGLTAALARVSAVLAPQLRLAPPASGVGERLADLVPKALPLPHLRLPAAAAEASPSVTSPSPRSMPDAARPAAAPAAVEPMAARPADAPVAAPAAPVSATAQPQPTARPEGASLTAGHTAPTILFLVRPVYPEGAIAKGIEGEVEFEFALAGDGTVRDVRVVESNPVGEFEVAARRALDRSRFSPPTSADADRRYRQTFVFSLRPQTAPEPSEDVRAAGDVAAQTGCRIVTGSHICRRPDEFGPAFQPEIYGAARGMPAPSVP
ncbi:peptidase M56 BlaR1 [Mizugakiibacter sediminis]|uniref:Peptidase M56 BlaR1 n=1 Tax=Mizugakiibacter sediminis TaxID=1475481 RepID=A0A0K8QJS2_9GAMM|nr:M56 family metallopeptidase [Mizugakiibacter sediminis]GAP65084.1 peptidase M56 BlaR1 [Mizugakiibacter sediminis]